MLSYALKNKLYIDEAEQRYPFLLHQRISKLIAESVFNITDPNILSAIECHTTLKANPTAYDMKISINDFILRATAIALKESPNINVSLEGNEMVYKTEINVGMAVALEDGLIVPVIRDADKLSLVQIAGKSKELAGKAKNGGLLPDDYTGGTFTVSNLGMRLFCS